MANKTIAVNPDLHRIIKQRCAADGDTMPECVEKLMQRAKWAESVAQYIHQIGASLPAGSRMRVIALELADQCPLVAGVDEDEREAMRPPGPEAAL